MALVIWAVLLTDLMRRRMSRLLGMIKTPKPEFPSPPEIRGAEGRKPKRRKLARGSGGGVDAAFISRSV
jgi:hypothetical protein